METDNKIIAPLTDGAEKEGERITECLYNSTNNEDCKRYIIEKEKFLAQRALRGLAFQKLGKCKNVPSIFLCRHSVRGDFVSLEAFKDSKFSYFSGVQHCHTAWACPYCSSLLALSRSVEMQWAIHKWHALEFGRVYLVTQTMAHNSRMALSDSLSLLASASSAFWREFNIRLDCRAFQIQYRITNTEVTDGVNGWHPHHHLLLFVPLAYCADFERLEDRWGKIWCRVLNRLGGSAKEGVGLRIDGGDMAGNYVSGLSNEMGLSHWKQAKKEHENYWSYLAKYTESPSPFLASRLWEYIEATKGRHVLQWARGMKDYFGIPTVSDRDIMSVFDSPNRKSNIYAYLGRDTYLSLPDEIKASLLELAANGASDSIRHILDELEKK